jgi:hypothetical protein
MQEEVRDAAGARPGDGGLGEPPGEPAPPVRALGEDVADEAVRPARDRDGLAPPSRNPARVRRTHLIWRKVCVSHLAASGVVGRAISFH